MALPMVPHSGYGAPGISQHAGHGFARRADLQFIFFRKSAKRIMYRLAKLLLAVRALGVRRCHYRRRVMRRADGIGAPEAMGDGVLRLAVYSVTLILLIIVDM